MKRISIAEYKKILIDELKYINAIAKKNNIKYTLVGGSLIGAIRHGGIIPWDDDIDIGLLPEQYDKLIEAIKKDNNERYRVLAPDTEESYYYPFAKLVDTWTTGYEINCKKIDGYGAYIDIFKYNNIPDDKKEIEKYYKRCSTLRKKLFSTIVVGGGSVFVNMYHRIMSKKDSRKAMRKIVKESEKYNNKTTSNVMINWTPYGAKRETHARKLFNDYILVKFEDTEAMIISGYDKMLKTTFGDYMTPPPKELRRSHHHMEMFLK